MPFTLFFLLNKGSVTDKIKKIKKKILVDLSVYIIIIWSFANIDYQKSHTNGGSSIPRFPFASKQSKKLTLYHMKGISDTLVDLPFASKLSKEQTVYDMKGISNALVTTSSLSTLALLRFNCHYWSLHCRSWFRGATCSPYSPSGLETRGWDIISIIFPVLKN